MPALWVVASNLVQLVKVGSLLLTFENIGTSVITEQDSKFHWNLPILFSAKPLDLFHQHFNFMLNIHCDVDLHGKPLVQDQQSCKSLGKEYLRATISYFPLKKTFNKKPTKYWYKKKFWNTTPWGFTFSVPPLPHIGKWECLIGYLIATVYQDKAVIAIL